VSAAAAATLQNLCAAAQRQPPVAAAAALMKTDLLLLLLVFNSMLSLSTMGFHTTAWEALQKNWGEKPKKSNLTLVLAMFTTYLG
jgi:hypothetical protein